MSEITMTEVNPRHATAMTTSIRYRVSVTWNGVTRTTDLEEESARFVVVDAVRLGHEVTCVALNVGDEPIEAALPPQEH